MLTAKLINMEKHFDTNSLQRLNLSQRMTHWRVVENFNTLKLTLYVCSTTETFLNGF